MLNHIATNDAQILACFDAIKELRPHLDAGEYLRRVKDQQAQGYTLIYRENGNEVMAAAGFRIASFLAWGKILYIDDLITREKARGQGFGSSLLKWIVDEAKAKNCHAVHLDTGHHRFDAHRLYLNHGFQIRSHHLSLDLAKRPQGRPS